MTYKEIVAKVAEDTGLPVLLVDRTYKAYWRTIREYVSSLPLKEELSPEDFAKLKPNVNIPSLGKLYVNVDRYNAMKKSYRMYLNMANK